MSTPKNAHNDTKTIDLENSYQYDANYQADNSWLSPARQNIIKAQQELEDLQKLKSSMLQLKQATHRFLTE